MFSPRALRQRTRSKLTFALASQSGSGGGVEYGVDREVHVTAGQEAGATRSYSDLDSSFRQKVTLFEQAKCSKTNP